MSDAPSRAVEAGDHARPLHRHGRLFATAALAAGALWGCSDSLVEVGGELTLTLDGPTSAPLSDSVAVNYAVRGRSLLGLVLTYDDGVADTVFFSGSQSAGGVLTHRYEEAGTYRILGVVQDAIEGSVTEELSVTVTP